ncbi:MAG: RHS repeat-associated core domain-containing protein [Chitinispirillaceae bacterium]|jgi:RHS repeat-associated protein
MQKLTASWPMKKPSALSHWILLLLSLMPRASVSQDLLRIKSFILRTALLLSAFSLSYSQTPNYTETTLYNVDGLGNNVKSRAYSDGLNREIQSQTTINANDVLISGNEYDEVGRLSKAAKPFKLANNSTLAYVSGSIVAQAIAAWPKGAGYDSAYSQIQYYSDPLSRTYATGAPGDSFTVSNHASKFWSFGVTGTYDASADFDANGFLYSSLLDTTTLNTKIPTDLAAIDQSLIKYHLTVSMDPNGHFTQNLKDIFGNVLRTWNLTGAAGDPVVSNYYFTIMGEALTETPPQTTGMEVNSTRNVYNTAGQLIAKYTPDAHTTYYAYDDEGRLSDVTDSNTAVSPRTPLHYTYDAMGRNLTIEEVSGGGSNNTRVRNIFDDTIGLRSYCANSSFPTGAQLETIITSLTDLRGHTVASIAYDQNYVGAYPGGEGAYAKKVIDLYSYDDDGHVAVKYKSIPGVPLQQMTYTYDIHGKMLTEMIYNGSTTVTTAFSYDANGRCSKISRGGNDFVRYVYDDFGKLQTKTFVNRSAQTWAENYTYTIRDWMSTNTTQNSTFAENLYYNEINTGVQSDNQYNQFNGNVSRAQSTITGLPGNPAGASLNCVYSYDKANRLVAVDNRSDNSPTDEFDASFSYLGDGRFLQKHEGTAQSGWGNYAYYPNMNRLVGITNGGARSGDVTTPAYIYDFNGNMVLDRSKNMTIEYDWRNMAMRFNIYDNIPSDINTWDKVRALYWDTRVHRTSEILMTYDATGNRVKKESVDPTVTLCPSPDANDGSLVFTNVDGTTFVVKPWGALMNCKPLVGLNPAPPSGSLRFENNDILQAAFASTGLFLGGLLGENHIGSNPGDFVADNPGSPLTPKFVIDQNSGSLFMASQSTDRQVLSGVAYVDGEEVFVYNTSTSSYQLSYTRVAGEGVSRPSGNFEFYVKDHLGSTRVVIAEDWTLQQAFAYFAYGKQIPLLTPSPDLMARDEFTGKELDAEAGINLDYFGARYYDADIGLFTTCDPMLEFWNPYGYTNNPILFVDPNGLNIFKKIGHFFKKCGDAIGKAARAIGAVTTSIIATVVVDAVGIGLFCLTGGAVGWVGAVWIDDKFHHTNFAGFFEAGYGLVMANGSCVDGKFNGSFTIDVQKTWDVIKDTWQNIDQQNHNNDYTNSGGGGGGGGDDGSGGSEEPAVPEDPNSDGNGGDNTVNNTSTIPVCLPVKGFQPVDPGYEAYQYALSAYYVQEGWNIYSYSFNDPKYGVNWKCNILVGDSYTLGAGVDFPTYSDNGHYLGANHLADPDYQLPAGWTRVPYSQDAARLGDVIAIGIPGLGHCGDYAGQGYFIDAHMYDIGVDKISKYNSYPIYIIRYHKTQAE